MIRRRSMPASMTAGSLANRDRNCRPNSSIIAPKMAPVKMPYSVQM